MPNTFPYLSDHNELHRVRFEKAEAMRAAGIDPYPAKFTASHLSAQILSAEDEYVDQADKPVSVLGRVLAIRRFGKSTFFHVRDRAGQIQVFIDKKRIDEASFEVHKQFLDSGDIVGVEGTVFRTKMGEVSIHADRLVLLTKSLRPLPEKWKGLTDKETRYRQRYVDLIANPDVAELFVKRSRMIASLRRWLDDQEFLEVETPMMQPLYGGASARPFTTHHNALDMELYLRIAPELYLKRLMVGGLHRVYEINRNFRNEGISTQHNPEFTMLELYAAGWDCEEMMQFVEELVRHAMRAVLGEAPARFGELEVDLSEPFPRLSILGGLEKYCNVKARWDMSVEEARAAVAPRHVPDDVQSAVDILIHVFEEEVEQHLVRPTFVTEFPKAVSPLAKAKPGDAIVADRFELYVNKMELANGFSELNDPAEQHARFAEQVRRRAGGDLEAVGVIDEDYVRALEHGMPPAAGLGVGIDRLAMAATGAASIRDVILFPLMKPVSQDAAATEEDVTGTEEVAQ